MKHEVHRGNGQTKLTSIKKKHCLYVRGHDLFEKYDKFLLSSLLSTAGMAEGLNIMQNAAHLLTALTQVPSFKA